MKTFEEMSFNEKVAWATGELIVAIGEGKFRERMWAVCSTFTGDAYDRGIIEGRRRTEKEAKEAQEAKEAEARKEAAQTTPLMLNITLGREDSRLTEIISDLEAILPLSPKEKRTLQAARDRLSEIQSQGDNNAHVCPG